MKVENCDVVIIGSGVAGLICALSLNKKFKIIANFEEEWQKYKGDKSSIPTAGFGVIGEVAEKDPELVKKFQVLNEEEEEYTDDGKDLDDIVEEMDDKISKYCYKEFIKFINETKLEELDFNC